MITMTKYVLMITSQICLS